MHEQCVNSDPCEVTVHAQKKKKKKKKRHKTWTQQNALSKRSLYRVRVRYMIRFFFLWFFYIEFPHFLHRISSFSTKIKKKKKKLSR